MNFLHHFDNQNTGSGQGSKGSKDFEKQNIG